MKIKFTSKIGNGFMGIGMCTMLIGFTLSILSYVPEVGLSMSYAQGAIIGIFLGAFIWLVGVRISGTECIVDKYWAVRRVQLYKKQRQHLKNSFMNR